MLTLVDATLEDVNILTDIEKAVFDYDVISLKQMRYLIKSGTAIVVKAVVPEDTIAGYMVLLRRRNSKVLRIYSICVLQDYRKKVLAAFFYAAQKRYAAPPGVIVFTLKYR